MKKILIVLSMCILSLTVNAQNDFKEADKALSEIVKKALSVAEKTGDFVIEQAPALLQEFYRWHIAKSILTIFISSFLIVILLLLIKNRRKHIKTGYTDMGDPDIFFPIAFCVIGISVSAFWLIENIYDLIYITLAPKLYLIDYFLK